MQTTNPSNFMKLITMLFAAFVLAACSSTATDDAPAAPQDDQEAETAPIAAPAPVEEEPSDFDGNIPLDANGNPLDRTFYFGYDKSVLNQADLAALELHAQLLRRNPDKSVVIEGHCDERGTREYNLALGERRADAVRDFLSSAGVSSRQLETVSYGEEQPQDPGHSEGAWQRNRRAVLSYR